MKHPLSAPLFLKLGLLISACFVTLGFSATNDEDSYFKITQEPSRLDDASNLWETEPAPLSKDRDATLRNAQILFSLEHLDSPPAFPLSPEDIREGLQLESEAAEMQPTTTQPTTTQPTPVQPAAEPLAPIESLTPVQPPPAQAAEPSAPAKPGSTANGSQDNQKILINFNNVSIIEFIRFISRISNKNFVFDENDLQFNVTIISEEPTTIENILTALIQELRIHDLTLIEQGNNLIIHKNLKVNSVSKVVAEDLPGSLDSSAEIVTQVFRLNTLDPTKAATVIRPLISDRALVEPLRESNHLIVTDVASNVNQIGDLLKSIDAPNSGLVIGQYVARTTDIDTLLPLVQKIMMPISQDQPLTFVPYTHSNSIFIVSTPFLVERSISILQHLDQEKGRTRIIEMKELKFEQPAKPGPTGPAVPIIPARPAGEVPSRPVQPVRPTGPAMPTIPLDGGWEFGPSQAEIERERERERAAEAAAAAQQPIFIPVEVPCPAQEFEQAPPPLNIGVTEDYEEEHIPVEKFLRPFDANEVAPVPAGRMKFYIHKLQYRTGDCVLGQLQQIGQSLQATTTNTELLAAINTIQWLQCAKALVITATPEVIDKIRILIEQLDTPLRQVFIEMLILQTTVDDSFHFGVDWGTRFGGGNQAGSMGFQEGASTLQGSLDSTGVTDLGGQFPNPTPNLVTPFNNALIPDPRNLAKANGFHLGVMGQHIIHKGLGLQFNSIGALVTAIHDFASTNIIMSPKIITEDGVPAQIFVGINTPFKTQSVSNDLGSIITNNFTYQDVGTSLQVTPHIYNCDLISLDIIEEVSSLATTPASTGNSNEVIGPTTNKNATRTSILVPDGFFVILSGMMQDEVDENRSQIPCLGSLPIAGAAFSDTRPIVRKRNLMIFIRPQIIDTDEEIQNITRHQQDVWKVKNVIKPKWQTETEATLDWANVRATFNTDDIDDLPCCEWVH
ncbi:MAG: type III secretion protein [Parachlamydia sp.]|nr:type III secretion protein [Parachlamydia sp.]